MPRKMLPAAGRCPDFGDRTDVAGSREAPGSLHPADRADARPARGARAVAPSDDATGDEGMGVYSKLRGFALAHRGGGELHGGAGPHTPDGYRPWARCSCGARSCGSTKPCDEPMAVHVLELMSRTSRSSLYASIASRCTSPR